MPAIARNVSGKNNGLVEEVSVDHSFNDPRSRLKNLRVVRPRSNIEKYPPIRSERLSDPGYKQLNMRCMHPGCKKIIKIEKRVNSALCIGRNGCTMNLKFTLSIFVTYELARAGERGFSSLSYYFCWFTWVLTGEISRLTVNSKDKQYAVIGHFDRHHPSIDTGNAWVNSKFVDHFVIGEQTIDDCLCEANVANTFSRYQQIMETKQNLNIQEVTRRYRLMTAIVAEFRPRPRSTS